MKEKFKVDLLYGPAFIKPEMCFKIIPPEPPTWKEKLLWAWEDFKQIMRIALMFFFWALSLSILMNMA